MECPHCGHAKSSIFETRVAPLGIRRRRECQACHKRFTTYENVYRVPTTNEEVFDVLAHALRPTPK